MQSAGRISRRSLLAAGSGALLLPALPAAAGRRPPFATEGSFAQGVAAGHPAERAISLWTRLDGAERPLRLGYEVAADPGFGELVARGQAVAHPVRDHTVHVRLRSRRLRPGERYWYRFFTARETSAVGRFVTRRPPDSRETVRCAFFSCQGWEAGYYAAHAELARRDDLDLVVCLGDYVYEKTDDRGPRRDEAGGDGTNFVQTLPEYRAKYRLYKSDASLQAMQAAHAFAAIWDNHELASDDPGHIAGAPIRVPRDERSRHGRIAFFEFHPGVRFARDRERIYRRIPLGVVDVLLLDLHSYARPHSDQVNAEGNDPERCFDPSRTYLGAAQREWLKGQLAASRAPWKVLCSPTMMMGLDIERYRTFNANQWDGRAAERRELMEHVLGAGVSGVTVQSGDVHTFFAGQVTPTGRDDSPPAATEFIGGAISSEGVTDAVSEDPNAARLAQLLTEGGIKALNPHISYTEHRRRGYAVAEFRPGEMLVEFRSPESVAVPESPVATLARFRVPREEPRVEAI